MQKEGAVPDAENSPKVIPDLLPAMHPGLAAGMGHLAILLSVLLIGWNSYTFPGHGSTCSNQSCVNPILAVAPQLPCDVASIRVSRHLSI